MWGTIPFIKYQSLRMLFPLLLVSMSVHKNKYQNTSSDGFTPHWLYLLLQYQIDLEENSSITDLIISWSKYDFTQEHRVTLWAVGVFQSKGQQLSSQHVYSNVYPGVENICEISTQLGCLMKKVSHRSNAFPHVSSLSWVKVLSQTREKNHSFILPAKRSEETPRPYFQVRVIKWLSQSFNWLKRF